MGVIKFKQRDKNRFRKIYPFLRRKPVYETILEGSANIEVGAIDYNNTDTGSYSFTSTFTSVPTITATAIEETSMPGSTPGNVNVYVTAISIAAVTIRVSDANFVGRVHLHAISAS